MMRRSFVEATYVLEHKCQVVSASQRIRMITAEYGDARFKDCTVFRFGLVETAERVQDSGMIAATGEGIRMPRSEEARKSSELLSMFGFGFG